MFQNVRPGMRSAARHYNIETAKEITCGTAFFHCVRMYAPASGCAGRLCNSEAIPALEQWQCIYRRVRVYAPARVVQADSAEAKCSCLPNRQCILSFDAGRYAPTHAVAPDSGAPSWKQHAFLCYAPAFAVAPRLCNSKAKKICTTLHCLGMAALPYLVRNLPLSLCLLSASRPCTAAVHCQPESLDFEGTLYCVSCHGCDDYDEDCLLYRGPGGTGAQDLGGSLAIMMLSMLLHAGGRLPAEYVWARAACCLPHVVCCIA